MDRSYDIFETLPDDTVLWRDFRPGLENAISHMRELAKLSTNEFSVIHVPTQETMARANVRDPG